MCELHLSQIAETYAFLPREAVTRFLMSCTECQKRMHFNSNGLEPKGRGGCVREGWQEAGCPIQGPALCRHRQQLSQFPEAAVDAWGCPESLGFSCFVFTFFIFKALVLLKNQQNIPTALQGSGQTLFFCQGSSWECHPAPFSKLWNSCHAGLSLSSVSLRTSLEDLVLPAGLSALRGQHTPCHGPPLSTL